MALQATRQQFYPYEEKKSHPTDGTTLRHLGDDETLQHTDSVSQEGMAERPPSSRVDGLSSKTLAALSHPPLPAGRRPTLTVAEAHPVDAYIPLHCLKDERTVLGLYSGRAERFFLPSKALRSLTFLALLFVVEWLCLDSSSLLTPPTNVFLHPY